MTLLVSLITPDCDENPMIARRATLQGEFFQRRGDQPVLYTGAASEAVAAADLEVERVRLAQLDERPPHFAASDLYIFHAVAHYPLLEVMAHLERGAVILYVYASSRPEREAEERLGRLAAYADLIVAEGQAAADDFVQNQGYTALPVHVLPVDDKTSPEEYAIYWTEAVAKATDWLPNRPFPFGALPALASVHPPANKRDNATSPAPARLHRDDPMLEADLQQLLSSAKTMQRDYVVRSRLPLIGSLLAWLRRNLTSHLREPYIDPTFQRQEAFNQLTAQTIIRLTARITQLEAQMQERTPEVQAGPEMAKSDTPPGAGSDTAPPASNQRH
jgi:hypothetical protein